MYIVRVAARLMGATILALAFVSAASAQTTPQPAEHQHAAPVSSPGEHGGHNLADMARDGSGTAWLPDQSPMYAVHVQRGPWTLMFHENAFLQHLHESGTRGDHQTGSINWVMGMATRTVGYGTLGLRGMFSAEPWTIRGCGYPDLLASGERCDGNPIHDRQHPHDLFMELSASYDAPIRGATRWQVYAAPAGEPALGPVAFPHRVSAMPNPLAPISHHWMEATHVSFGVLTGGVYGHRWKAEASAFNGREPDARRTDFDFGALDSVSGRLWFLPTPTLAFQMSLGRLTEAEPSDAGGPGTDVMRATASATYHAAFREDSIWATTIAWGRNSEPDHASNALLLETDLTFADRDTWYGRFEAVGKSAHDLAVPESADHFTVAKLQGGYTRYLPARHGAQLGVGAGLSLGFVPESLNLAYGRRMNVGFALYLTTRPASMRHSPPAAANTPAAPSSRPHMVSVQTSVDPAKLACTPAVDPTAAARATYQGTIYYFCSVKDRDEFLTDPKMSLSMRPPNK